MFEIVKISRTWIRGTLDGRSCVTLRKYKAGTRYKKESTANGILTRLGWAKENKIHKHIDEQGREVLNFVGWEVRQVSKLDETIERG